jgi:hypothetical protein
VFFSLYKFNVMNLAVLVPWLCLCVTRSKRTCPTEAKFSG